MHDFPEHATHPPVTILTGAGISIPVGIPAMGGMFTSFLDRSKSGITTKEKKLASFFCNELGAERDLEEFLLLANSIIELPNSGLSTLVERSISRQPNAKKLATYRNTLNAYVDHTKSLRDRILSHMARSCFQFDRARSEAIFSAFVRSTAQQGYPIYTTNYDFCLEHVAQELDLAINDNFVPKGQRYIWNDKIQFNSENGLTLIKLHGSVAWYINRKGSIEKIYSNTDLNPVGEEINRLVITPTRFKDIYAQNFFALYSEFLSSLSSSHCLIIAGHSLRDDYLRAAIIERARKGDFSVILIDPYIPNSLSSELPIGRLGAVDTVTHVPFLFEEFSDELAHIFQGTSPVDIANECAKVVRQRRRQSNKLRIKGRIGALKSKTRRTFSIEVKCYLKPSEKPAKIHVWLEADIPAQPETSQRKVTGKFIESTPILVGTECTGRVDTEYEVTIVVPEMPQWASVGRNIKVVAALLRRPTTRPSTVVSDNIIAKATRPISYSL